MQHDADARLRRALAYPGPPAAASFRLGPPAPGPPVARRTLLAYGSNGSPAVLEAKLGPGARVAGRVVTLGDHDVAYSAHLSAYGAIPATLVRSPGTRVRVVLLRLGAPELERLDATEPNYARVVLLAPALEPPPPDGPIEVYRSRHGLLRVDGAPLALSAIPASGRTLPAGDERRALSHARDRLAPGCPLAEFVNEAVAETATRRAWTAILRAEGA